MNRRVLLICVLLVLLSSAPVSSSGDHGPEYQYPTSLAEDRVVRDWFFFLFGAITAVGIVHLLRWAKHH